MLPNLQTYNQYMNSVAHSLGFINEANYCFEVLNENYSVFDYLKGGR